MATMSLAYAATTITFSPAPGYAKTDILEKLHTRARNGTLNTYKFFVKLRWEIPLSWVGSTDAGNFNTWWSNCYDCTFIPDTVNAPGTSYTVRIVNDTRPLGQFSGPNWETYYQGSLILEQV
jgi:hypothetical protein